jgi:hypothetical protein
VSLWFLKGNTDKKIFASKAETIKSLQNAMQSKEDVLSKDDALIDSGNAAIKQLQGDVHAKDDSLVKDKVLIDSQTSMMKSLEASLKSDESTLLKDNDIISHYQQQVAQIPPSDGPEKKDEGMKIYPKDNGFEAQDLGSGFSSYKVLGPMKNPNHIEFPKKVSNETPWKFGPGNSGIAANGSAYFVTGATNLDSDGTVSTSGQAASLEYAGSSVSQMIKLPAGTFSVTFDYEARRDYTPNQIAVSIDGQNLFSHAPADCNHFQRVTTKTITLAAAGKHELMFRGLGNPSEPSGFPCTFIDNVSIDVVQLPPSPESELAPDISEMHGFLVPVILKSGSIPNKYKLTNPGD